MSVQEVCTVYFQLIDKLNHWVVTIMTCLIMSSLSLQPITIASLGSCLSPIEA